MKAVNVNGTPLSQHLSGFSGGVVRVKNGRLEVYGGDDVETVIKNNGGVVRRKPAAKMAEPGAVPAVTRKVAAEPKKIASADPNKPPTAAKRGNVALPGPDGRQAAQLLKTSEKEGVRVLLEIAAAAVGRAMRRREIKFGGLPAELFTPAEMTRLAESIAATNSTANLLGRARVKLRQQKAEEMRENFAEDDPTPFNAFADASGTPAPITPLMPEKAVFYFRSLVPKLGVDPIRFGTVMRRDAFTAARATSNRLLRKIQRIILDALQSGEKISSAPEAIKAVLDRAGVSRSSTGYAINIFRTNMMDAYVTGGEEERMTPDSQEMFPVWRYLGIDDGREGADHRPHFDKYFPAATPFQQIRNMFVVRGGVVVPDPTGKGRPFQCRCVPQAISKFQWARLKKQGAKIADGYLDPTEPSKFSESAAQTFAEGEQLDDLIACEVSPPVAKRLELPTAGELTRLNFRYREAKDLAGRCGNCTHYEPEIEDRLGTCMMFKCLHERSARYNLLADVGAHMVCSAMEPKRLEAPEMAETFAEQAPAVDLDQLARDFWKIRSAKESEQREREKSVVAATAEAMSKMQQPPTVIVEAAKAPEITVQAPAVNIKPVIEVNVPEIVAGDVHVTVPPQAPPVIEVKPTAVIQPPAAPVINTTVVVPKRKPVKTVVKRDSSGNVTETIEKEVDEV